MVAPRGGVLELRSGSLGNRECARVIQCIPATTSDFYKSRGLSKDYSGRTAAAREVREIIHEESLEFSGIYTTFRWTSER